MRMVKMLIQIPRPIKDKLDQLRTQGYTTSGFIRAVLERELGQTSKLKKGTNQ